MKKTAIEKYIDEQIRLMKQTIEFVNEGCVSETYPTRMERIDFALWSLEQDKTSAFGVLSYAKHYERTITDELFNDLKQRVLKAWSECEDLAWNTIE